MVIVIVAVVVIVRLVVVVIALVSWPRGLSLSGYNMADTSGYNVAHELLSGLRL